MVAAMDMPIAAVWDKLEWSIEAADKKTETTDAVERYSAFANKKRNKAILACAVIERTAQRRLELSQRRESRAPIGEEDRLSCGGANGEDDRRRYQILLSQATQMKRGVAAVLVLAAEFAQGRRCGGSKGVDDFVATQSEDSQVEEADNAGKPRRSHAWLHFQKQGKRAMCNYCKKTYAADGNTHGTTNLNKHFKNCPKNPNRVIDKAQKTIVLGKAACKYVKGSPARLAMFKVCVKDANISRSKKVITDVATRWNSTYLMLEVASKYAEAFNRLEDEDPSYVSELQVIEGTPNAYDWNRACVFINFLKIFYDDTLTFSSSLHVSANCFFRKLVKIHSALGSWIQGGDLVLKNMAVTMKSKFDKYWSDESINYLLFVAVYLDPRYKLEYLDLCFEWMYGAEKAKTIVAKLEELISKLFDHYKSLHPVGFVDSDVTSSSNNTIQSDVVTMSVGGNVDMDALHKRRVKKRQIEQKSSDLVRYKEDEVEDDYEGFDLLKWWKQMADFIGLEDEEPAAESLDE
ncbi:unnamed protein product [Trifolium pratense]|uniref:Uncharacterized protein n=1 Tax=Trifolium pratense TaxID=57577 RepID=A0ACB0LEL8_TRIPR|nr:unnamed protein product [Trifolium pratense]